MLLECALFLLAFVATMGTGLQTNTSTQSQSLSVTNDPQPPGWPVFEFDSYEMLGFGNGDANSYKCNALGRNFSCQTKGQCYMCEPSHILSNVSSGSTAWAHTLVALPNGTLVGTGARVLLGLGAPSNDTSCIDHFVTIPLPDGKLAARVSAASGYSAVLTTNWDVFVFGFNRDGVFGVPEDELPFVTSPMHLNLTAVLRDDSILANSSIAVAASLRSLFVILHNGSVVSLGRGILRGPDAYAVTATLFRSIPCFVRSIHVGAVHAFANCTDGTIFGWGDNDQKQIVNSSVINVTTPIYVPVHFWAAVSGIALGAGHSVVVTSDGSVYGRGSNAHGELGLPSSVVQVDDWQKLPIPQDYTYLDPMSVAAGSAHTAVLTKYASQVPGTSTKSNMFTAGSNSACGLGIRKPTSEVVNVFAAEQVPYTIRESTMRVAFVVAGEYRRSFLFVYHSGTASASRSRNSMTLSKSSSATNVISDSMSFSITPPPTKTRSSSHSLPSTKTVSVVQSGTITMTTSLANTPSIFTPSKSRSLSLTMPPKPNIKDVRFTPRNDVVSILFDRETDQYDSNVTRYARSPAAVNSLFRIHGILQSFGLLYYGEWLTPSHFALTTDPHGRNITIGVAAVCAANESNIRNSNRTSLPAEHEFCVSVVEVAAPYSTVTEAGGMPTGLLVGIIIICCAIALLLLIGLPLLVMHDRARKARRAREKEAQRRGVVAVSEPRGQRITYTEPIEGTVTFSPTRGRNLEMSSVEVADMAREPTAEVSEMPQAVPQAANEVPRENEQSFVESAASQSPSPQRGSRLGPSGSFIAVGRSPVRRQLPRLSRVAQELHTEARARPHFADLGDGEEMLPAGEEIYTVEHTWLGRPQTGHSPF